MPFSLPKGGSNHVRGRHIGIFLRRRGGTVYLFPYSPLVDHSPHFKHLSADVKLLYGMLLDSMNLSVKNGWRDEDGRVHIYYTVEEICGDMNCGRDKAMKILADLDAQKGLGLIRHVRQGQGRLTKFYVKRFTTGAVPPQPAPPESSPFLPVSGGDFPVCKRLESLPKLY